MKKKDIPAPKLVLGVVYKWDEIGIFVCQNEREVTNLLRRLGRDVKNFRVVELMDQFEVDNGDLQYRQWWNEKREQLEYEKELAELEKEGD